MRQSRSAVTLAIAIAACCAATPVNAQVVFETATKGPSVTATVLQPLLRRQLLGTRFFVDEPVTVTAMGGHLLAGTGPGTAAASLVSLTGPNDVPDSFDRSTPDILATTTLTATTPSSDVQAPIVPRVLTPGWYGLLYGDYTSGPNAVMVRGNIKTGSPTFFTASDPDPAYREWTIENDVRFFVVGVPEPAIGAASGALLALLTTARTRRRPLSP